jgi:hypothetical protein
VAQRLARAELRDLLLRAGTDLVLEEGLPCGFDHLTFHRVFDRIESQTGRRVTRASVYDRLWTNQTEYQWDVLAQVVEDASKFDRQTFDLVQDLLDKADRSTEEGRWECMHALCRAVPSRHVVTASQRQGFRVVIAAVGAIASANDECPEPEYVTRVRAALRGYLEAEIEGYLELFNIIGAFLGFRVRQPYDLRHFALAVGALGEGVALRLNFLPGYNEEISLPDVEEIDGERLHELDRGWNVTGIGVDAVARVMLEIDPDWPGPG